MKILGKIDLNAINGKLRPAKKTKEEKEALRQEKAEEAKQYNRNMVAAGLKKDIEELHKQITATEQRIEDLNTRLENGKTENETRENERQEVVARLEHLQRKAIAREKYLASPITNNQRQKELHFNGIRPQKMDVVHFFVPKTAQAEEMDGIALVRDENHYYIAVDMYDHEDMEDNITTMVDENPDGTFDGIWPEHVILREASRFEERFMRKLTDQYAEELDKAEVFIAQVARQERQEIEELTVKVEELNAQMSACDADMASLAEACGVLNVLRIDLAKKEKELENLNDVNESSTGETVELSTEASPQKNEANAPCLPSGTPDEDSPQSASNTDIELRCPHLPYLRGKRQMETMDWPAIDTDYKAQFRFRLMGNIARLVDKLQRAHALTYVLSEEYYNELRNRARRHYKGMKPDDVVAEGDRADGVIVYPSQGYEDTVLYSIDRRSQLSILIVYIREGRLLFYESYSVQEIVGHPRTDSYLCKSLRESGTDVNRLFSWLRNFIVSFLAMERDMERTVNYIVEEGSGETEETDLAEGSAIDTTDNRDVVVRDASWYTDITVNREIPVRGYVSHRWCGCGNEKYLREVWVRPHIKSGYHRTAGVKNVTTD